MSLKLTTPPALEPVTLAEMKSQCGFGPMEDTDKLREDVLAEDLRAAIRSAREQCENETGRAFITQTWTMTLNRFPRWGDKYLVHEQLEIDLPRPTLQSLDTFTYLDATGTAQDMMATGAWGYQVSGVGGDEPALLRPPSFLGWPLTQLETTDTVTIVFTCGFGDNPEDVPYSLRQAVKLRSKWYFEGASGPEPSAVRSLLNQFQNMSV